MADSVAAITGLDPAQAASYLEMAGGDVEMAVQLFFSMAEGEPAAAAPPPWIEQGFEFSAAPESRCGLLQGKNGPCGVLAAVNAELLAQKGCPPPSAAATEADLRAALAAILWRCASADAPAGAKESVAQEVVLARWEGAVGGPIVTESFAADGAASVAANLAPLMPALRQKGGVVLLCYACVLTRGVEALMTLLMAGRARGNVGAYGQDGAKRRRSGDAGSGVGGGGSACQILSPCCCVAWCVAGVPLADPLKSPPLPVYVLHGGDHFTVAWVPLPAKERFEARVAPRASVERCSAQTVQC
ncbi:hypothetical protein EMIHUDRAFT_244613 [Emiliania huxleyi CCMP1516]|uniref:Deubiquitinating enzyme MINDY-3/4 conserved domain-containing protein n=2 Tax=Emiliania huxleyi TaxID=2903 RepID=A0A0D3J0C5_EMIH1|nr:hypothetical protein EMIHUDRAFT_244613 [Emiliania huxleyi CCMP1516]EOD16960.1 hypothetical protein EMIHUDRAFT_244613 [Emiliania huxleyi CCMP1516]|eukprot:XP_005769389.1 hypothetical protein EMIHUDRAFT_244613 [Emiliania huxleyi CCMP1516]